MAKKKNKKPQNQTFPKKIRLQKARKWIHTYNGQRKHLARGYRKQFHVDILCAIRELQEIGVEFDPVYVEAVKKSENSRIQMKHKKEALNKQKELEWFYEDSDETFGFIAGYTSGGAPYGITWDEMEYTPEPDRDTGDENDLDLPFD